MLPCVSRARPAVSQNPEEEEEEENKTPKVIFPHSILFQRTDPSCFSCSFYKWQQKLFLSLGQGLQMPRVAPLKCKIPLGGEEDWGRWECSPGAERALYARDDAFLSRGWRRLRSPSVCPQITSAHLSHSHQKLLALFLPMHWIHSCYFLTSLKGKTWQEKNCCVHWW